MRLRATDRKSLSFRCIKSSANATFFSPILGLSISTQFLFNVSEITQYQVVLSSIFFTHTSRKTNGYLCVLLTANHHMCCMILIKLVIGPLLQLQYVKMPLKQNQVFYWYFQPIPVVYIIITINLHIFDNLFNVETENPEVFLEN